MTDWQRLYEKRDWAGLEVWFHHTEERDQLLAFRDALTRDLPKVERENGLERRIEPISAKAAPPGWKEAARILHGGELDAAIAGTPPTALALWEQERSRVTEILERLAGEPEVTKGDASMSRRAHIATVMEHLKEFDFALSFMRGELLRVGETDDDIRWLNEMVAEIALPIFRAGIHAHAADGKAMEADAVRGKKVLKSAKEGGAKRVRENAKTNEACFCLDAGTDRCRSFEGKCCTYHPQARARGNGRSDPEGLLCGAQAKKKVVTIPPLSQICRATLPPDESFRRQLRCRASTSPTLR